MSEQSSGLFATKEGRECRRRPGTRLRVVAEAGSQPERESARSCDRAPSPPLSLLFIEKIF